MVLSVPDATLRDDDHPSEPVDPASEISLAEALASGGIIVDVRAPLEFAADRIPGALSVPLFSDRERAVVGTLFRHMGQGDARDWGDVQVRARLEPFVAELRKALQLPEVTPQARTLRRPRIICCARGGERSAAVTTLLRGLGHPVQRLTGGYRSFRALIRERLTELPVPTPVLLDGLTGCGKTAVLRAVSELRPRQVIDLEGLAQHRSSLLGDVGLDPAPQKYFESELVAAVDRLRGPWTLIEAESRRIGDREIPADLFRQMRAAPRIELRATLTQRIELLRDDYLGSGGEAAIAAVADRIGALAAYPRIGPSGVERLRTQLAAGEIDAVVGVLLAEHYDPRYRHGERKAPPIAVIDRKSVTETAEWLVERLDLHAVDCGGAASID